MLTCTSLSNYWWSRGAATLQHEIQDTIEDQIQFFQAIQVGGGGGGGQSRCNGGPGGTGGSSGAGFSGPITEAAGGSGNTPPVEPLHKEVKVALAVMDQEESGGGGRWSCSMAFSKWCWKYCI